jgi:DNA-binding transcriptional MocR family regulator
VKKKRATTERFVRLTHDLMECQAWRSLDGNARSIYIELAKLYRGAGTNNGQIGFSVRQAARAVLVSPATAARAMIQLQDRGFIVAMTKGNFTSKREATRWRLTEFDCDVTGQPASRDFESWGSADILPLYPGRKSSGRGTDG